MPWLSVTRPQTATEDGGFIMGDQKVPVGVHGSDSPTRLLDCILLVRFEMAS